MSAKTPGLKATVTAVQAALRAAGTVGAVGKVGSMTVVMSQGDRVEPAFEALRAAGYTLEIEGEGDYVKAAVVTVAPR